MALLMAERVDRSLSLFDPLPAGSGVARRRDGGLGGGVTLDDAIVGAWEGLAAQAIVACPLCGGALRPRSEHDDAGGHCGDCGTTLI